MNNSLRLTNIGFLVGSQPRHYSHTRILSQAQCSFPNWSTYSLYYRQTKRSPQRKNCYCSWSHFLKHIQSDILELTDSKQLEQVESIAMDKHRKGRSATLFIMYNLDIDQSSIIPKDDKQTARVAGMLQQLYHKEQLYSLCWQ